MEHYFEHMKKGMLKVLEKDEAVCKNAFSPSFTASEFVDFVLDNVLLLLVKGKTDCSTLLEIVRRTIYP